MWNNFFQRREGFNKGNEQFHCSIKFGLLGKDPSYFFSFLLYSLNLLDKKKGTQSESFRKNMNSSNHTIICIYFSAEEEEFRHLNSPLINSYVHDTCAFIMRGILLENEEFKKFVLIQCYNFPSSAKGKHINLNCLKYAQVGFTVGQKMPLMLTQLTVK